MAPIGAIFLYQSVPHSRPLTAIKPLTAINGHFCETNRTLRSLRPWKQSKKSRPKTPARTNFRTKKRPQLGPRNAINPSKVLSRSDYASFAQCSQKESSSDFFCAMTEWPLRKSTPGSMLLKQLESREQQQNCAIAPEINSPRVLSRNRLRQLRAIPQKITPQ